MTETPAAGQDEQALSTRVAELISATVSGMLTKGADPNVQKLAEALAVLTRTLQAFGDHLSAAESEIRRLRAEVKALAARVDGPEKPTEG